MTRLEVKSVDGCLKLILILQIYKISSFPDFILGDGRFQTIITQTNNQ